MWYDVLTHFDNNGYFQNGLTIPFLLGSNTVLNPHEKLLSTSDLLLEISNHSSKFTILYCGGIREYVLGKLDYETEKLLSKYKKGIYREFNNLIIVDNSFETLNEFDEIVSLLSNKYDPLIQSGYFSKNNDEWGNYSKIEKQRILEVTH